MCVILPLAPPYKQDWNDELLTLLTAVLSVYCQLSFQDDMGTWKLSIERIDVTVSHYNDVIMRAMASQITSLTIVFSIVNNWQSAKLN